MSTNKLNGAQVIVDYLIQEKAPYVFGLCGHGNIQFIDALFERKSRHQDRLGAPRERRWLHGRRLLPRLRPADRDLHVVRTGLGQLADLARQCLPQLGAVHGGDRQRADQPVQSRRLPGIVPPLSGRLPVDRALLLQEGVPADARRDGAARGAAGVEDHGDRTAGTGGARRAVRRVHGSGRRGSTKPGGMERQYLQPLRRRSGGRDQGGRHAACRRAAGHLRRSGRALGRCLRRAIASWQNGCRSRWQHRPAGSAPSTPFTHSALGLVARGGHYQANHATRQADVLLALGVRFDDRTSSSWIPGYSFTIPPTKLIHVDIDPEEIGRNYPGRARPDGRRAYLPAPGACRAGPSRRS